MLIISNPSVMMGKPTIAGTRVTVDSILERLAAGESHEQILEANTRLTPEDILAALAFAAQVLCDLSGRGGRGLKGWPYAPGGGRKRRCPHRGGPAPGGARRGVRPAHVGIRGRILGAANS
jgi:uncharacterized protein (DUF433 family)